MSCECVPQSSRGRVPDADGAVRRRGGDEGTRRVPRHGLDGALVSDEFVLTGASIEVPYSNSAILGPRREPSAGWVERQADDSGAVSRKRGKLGARVNVPHPHERIFRPPRARGKNPEVRMKRDRYNSPPVTDKPVNQGWRRSAGSLRRTGRSTRRTRSRTHRVVSLRERISPTGSDDALPPCESVDEEEAAAEAFDGRDPIRLLTCVGSSETSAASSALETSGRAPSRKNNALARQETNCSRRLAPEIHSAPRTPRRPEDPEFYVNVVLIGESLCERPCRRAEKARRTKKSRAYTRRGLGWGWVAVRTATHGAVVEPETGWCDERNSSSNDVADEPGACLMLSCETTPEARHV